MGKEAVKLGLIVAGALLGVALWYLALAWWQALSWQPIPACRTAPHAVEDWIYSGGRAGQVVRRDGYRLVIQDLGILAGNRREALWVPTDSAGPVFSEGLLPE